MSTTTYRSAETIKNTANDVADEAADMASGVVNRVSDTMRNVQDNVTQYFRDHDVRDMLDDVNGYVKKHPAQALVAAAALGFVLAAILRRR